MKRRLARKLKIPKLTWKIRKNKKIANKELNNNTVSQKRIDERHGKLKRQKNYIFSLLIIITLWTSLGSYVYLIPPEDRWAIPIFFVLLFITLLFTISFLFINTRRGFIVTIFILTFLTMSYFGVGNIINAVLLLVLIVLIERYTY